MLNKIKINMFVISAIVFSTTSFASEYLSVSKTPDNRYVWLVTSADGLFRAYSTSLNQSTLAWSRVSSYGTSEVSNVFNCPYTISDKMENLLVAFDHTNGMYFSVDGGELWQRLSADILPKSYTNFLFSCTQISHFSDSDIMNIVGVSGDKYMRGMLKLGGGERPHVVDGGMHSYSIPNAPLIGFDSLVFVSTNHVQGSPVDGVNDAGYFVALEDNSKLNFTIDKTANRWQKIPLTRNYQYAASQSSYPYLNNDDFFLVGGGDSGGVIQEIQEIKNKRLIHFDQGVITPSAFICSDTSCFVSYTNDKKEKYAFYDISRNSIIAKDYPTHSESFKVENVVFLENKYLVFTDHGIYVFDAIKKTFLYSAPIALPQQWQPEPIN